MLVTTFDHQTLTIIVAPFDPTARDLILTEDPEGGRRLDQASVPDWSIVGTAARIIEPENGDPSDRRFFFDVRVRRKSTFYLWRVLIPLTLLVFASWTVFWFEPTSLQPQISTSLAILLSFVTFNYAIDFSLPKVAYLTFIDRYILTSFAFSVTFAGAIIHVILAKLGDECRCRLGLTLALPSSTSRLTPRDGSTTSQGHHAYGSLWSRRISARNWVI
jgi:hypothetical protein